MGVEGANWNITLIIITLACNLQRPSTLAGAGGVYLSRWRRGPGLSYLLGRAGLTVASPYMYAVVRWPVLADGPAADSLKKAPSASTYMYLAGRQV
jgi:hypothetical protein